MQNIIYSYMTDILHSRLITSANILQRVTIFAYIGIFILRLAIKSMARGYAYAKIEYASVSFEK